MVNGSNFNSMIYLPECAICRDQLLAFAGNMFPAFRLFGVTDGVVLSYPGKSPERDREIASALSLQCVQEIHLVSRYPLGYGIAEYSGEFFSGHEVPTVARSAG